MRAVSSYQQAQALPQGLAFKGDYILKKIKKVNKNNPSL